MKRYIMGLNLITKAEYKSYVGINSPNEDALIDSLIPKVSQLIKNYCRRTFVDYIDDPKVDQFNGGEAFYLKEYPVVSVSSVEYSVDYGKTYVALTEYDDWVLNRAEDAIIPTSASIFQILVNGYKVTYTAGYESVPEDLKLAVFDLITYYRKNDSAIHSPKAPGTNSVQIEYITTTSLPAHIRRVLDLYVADYT